MHSNSISDLYFQIKQPCQTDLKIKGSRFIAMARKIETPEEAEAILKEISKEYPDATHHCYAWKIGHGKKARYHYSDNGEPNNTAGLPIFKAIEARNVTNLIIVVTRYFGGVKLGTGGLIRAYSKAASDLLKECETSRSFESETAVFKTSFEFVSVIHNIINSFRATLKDSTYGEEIIFTVEIRSSRFRDFRRKLKDGTNGQVTFLR